VDQVYDYVLSEGTPEYYQEFIDRFPYDPRCDHLRHLLVNLAQATAWHQAVLANSPVAYKNFFDRHGESPFAKAALHLQAEPKGVALMQASRLYRNGGGIKQMPFSGTAKITTLPARLLNTPTNGKVVNLPVGNKAGNAPVANKVNNTPVEHNVKPQNNNSKNSDRSRFERHQSNYGQSYNSQAHMGRNMYMGNNMRMGNRMRLGGGRHFGGGGGFGGGFGGGRGFGRF
jgi:hypothetical protein